MGGEDRTELEGRLSALAVAAGLWWAFVGTAGAAYVLTAPAIWQKLLGVVAVALAVVAIAVFTRAARGYNAEAGSTSGAYWETNLPDVNDVSEAGPRAKVA